ncbi:reverse transcriptase domain-containing protein [Tanacetum coccineum]
MKTPIIFPTISWEYVSDELIIIEDVMEGYLVCRVYADQGALVEVMFEHCFKNLSPAIKSRLNSTQTDLLGFAEDVVKPLGKIVLEVVFGDRGLFRRVMMKFTVIRAPSPYNVILGRTSLKTLMAVSSSIHSMVKFPTPRGIATLVTQTVIISECRRLEKKQMVEKEAHRTTPLAEAEPKEVSLMEEILDNLAYPEQLVTVEENLSEGCKIQLKALLKKNMDVFTWDPSDMMGVLRRIIEHSLNTKPIVEPFCQKRVLAPDRSRAVIKEVEELLRAGITLTRDTTKAQDDEEKTTFYTDQGTYCYTKMPFRLKMPELHIKDEKVLIADIFETFDNLQRINMKLNPKKCSFGVDEGKFMGYMVTSKGIKEETLYVYLAAAAKAVSAVLLTKRKGKQCLVLRGSSNQSHNGPAHRVNTKQSTSIREVSKIFCRVGNIQHNLEPRNAIKGKVLADFLSKAPVGSQPEVFFHVLAKKKEKDDTEMWTLFTDGASNSKGSRASNKAKYEALLAGIHMAARMKVQTLDVQVDSKLVASQINESYVANSTSSWQGSPERRLRDSYGTTSYAHQTSLKQSNEETPFSLTYGSEAVIPTEIGMPAYRTMMLREDEKEDELRLNMDLLQERREATVIREARYKTQMEQYYN